MSLSEIQTSCRATWYGVEYEVVHDGGKTRFSDFNEARAFAEENVLCGTTSVVTIVQ